MKYRGRKKYTPEEAGEQMENVMQMLTTLQEAVIFMRANPDPLIQALCRQTNDEMIEENLKKIEYCESKLKYMRKFNPEYRIKGSFGL